MSDPSRWRDGEGGASDELRALFAAGSRPRGMSAVERAAAVQQAAKIAAVPTSVWAAWSGAKLLAAGLALAGLIAGAVAVRARSTPPTHHPTAAITRPLPAPTPVAPSSPPPRDERAPTVAPAPSPPAHVTPPRVASVARPLRPSSPPSLPPPPPALPPPAELVGSSLPSAPAPSLAPAAAPPRDESLAAEAALLMRAQRSLEGDPAAALALLDAHAGFSHPALAQERELLAVLALRRLGRREAARTRGEALIARWPSGAAAQRVRGLLSSP